MHVLIWTPPWPVHGNLQFFRNAFEKHLCTQANSLTGMASQVTVVIPAHFEDSTSLLDERVAVVVLPVAVSQPPAKIGQPLYQKLYADPTSAPSKAIEEQLRPYLPDSVDVVLQWENPVPFLAGIFPDALIVNQMPGAFSRPPYPHTVIFDPIGLYRDGTFHRHATEIQDGSHLSDTARQLGLDFTFHTQSAMDNFRGVAERALDGSRQFDQIALLPLQASKHYAFSVDSGFDNQLDMLWSTLEQSDPNVGLIVTQYRNGQVADTPLDAAVAAPLRDAFPHFIYDPALEQIDSVSQYLLPHVDTVISASSSLPVQGMVWRNQIQVIGQTFLENYATNAPAASNLPWSTRCENTLATMVSRHQPLASAVTTDGEFLFNLLTAMRERQSAGAKGLDLLPDFTDIDPNYADELLGGFRVDRSLRSLQAAPQEDAATATLASLKELIDDPQTEMISFDVFDTLICRPVEKPADLYSFLNAKALALTDGIAVNFGKSRALCEVETRKELEGQKEEITLADIYQTLARFYGVDVQTLDALAQAEMALEIDHCRLRPFGKKMFDLALASHKPIILISDMYLPHETIAAMLESCGYGGTYDRLFLSCDFNCTKHTGDLFKVVLAEIEKKPHTVVHVGDNKQSDIIMAEQQGMRAFRWSSAVEWMRSNPHFKSVYSPRVGAGEKARSAIAGTTARGLFDGPRPASERSSLSGQDPYRLGFAVLGPLATGYMQWLAREAKRDGITELFFMAREGWVFKEVFDALYPAGPETPKTHYLLASRRAVRVAACRSPADVMALLGQPYDPGVALVELFEGRFGISFSQADDERIAALGFRNRQHTLDRSFQHQQQLCALAQEFMSEILTHAQKERTSYQRFLGENGFTGAKHQAIVDVGWKANIQGALGDLTQKRTTGYYYATVQDSELWLQQGDTHRAYLGIALSAPLTKSVVLQNRHLIEFMLCHSGQSLTSIREHGGDLRPAFRRESDLAKRRSLIDPLHRGAIAFARLYHDGFAALYDDIYIDPNLAEAALSAFIERPEHIDAKPFVGQVFSDAVGGLPERYIISPNRKAPRAGSTWHKGFAVAHEKQPTPRKPAKTPQEPATAARPRVEKTLMKAVTSRQKIMKYERDRNAFFEDSKLPTVRLYWKLLGSRYTSH